MTVMTLGSEPVYSLESQSSWSVESPCSHNRANITIPPGYCTCRSTCLAKFIGITDFAAQALEPSVEFDKGLRQLATCLILYVYRQRIWCAYVMFMCDVNDSTTNSAWCLLIRCQHNTRCDVDQQHMVFVYGIISTQEVVGCRVIFLFNWWALRVWCWHNTLKVLATFHLFSQGMPIRAAWNELTLRMRCSCGHKLSKMGPCLFDSSCDKGG